MEACFPFWLLTKDICKQICEEGAGDVQEKAICRSYKVANWAISIHQEAHLSEGNCLCNAIQGQHNFDLSAMSMVAMKVTAARGDALI